MFSVLALLLVVHSRQRRKPALSDDQLIGNVCDYREEGGGEADQGRYDIGPLRKPVLPLHDENLTQNGNGYISGSKPRKNFAPSLRMSDLNDKDGELFGLIK